LSVDPLSKEEVSSDSSKKGPDTLKPVARESLKNHQGRARNAQADIRGVNAAPLTRPKGKSDSPPT